MTSIRHSEFFGKRRPLVLSELETAIRAAESCHEGVKTGLPLQLVRISGGTGFHVGGGYVLTAGHVVDRWRIGVPYNPITLVFNDGWSDEELKEMIDTSHVKNSDINMDVTASKPFPKETVRVLYGMTNRDLDIGFLYVPLMEARTDIKPHSADIPGDLRLRSALHIEQGEPVTLVSLVDDEAVANRGIFCGIGNTQHNYGQILIRLEPAPVPGQSGSPLFDSEWNLLGVLITSTGYAAPHISGFNSTASCLGNLSTLLNVERQNVYKSA